jgi:tetratricopeptide (TPR) repeat protein
MLALKSSDRKGPAMTKTGTTKTRTLSRIGLIAAAALLATAVGTSPLYAMGDENPTPPPAPKVEKKKPGHKKAHTTHKKKQKKSEEEFLRKYHAARALIVGHDYRAGIAAMHAIGHDEHPDVANYIGYAYRKLGDYKDSQIWYEKALAADPDHVRTWSYYGMWQMEQGNRLKALDDLKKVELICGNTSCEEYRELKAVIDGKATY